MLENWKRNKILSSYVAQLPEKLAERYGPRDFYTSGQVKKTLDDCGFSEKYRGYAYAISLSFKDASEELGSTDLVNALRQEIGDQFFDGKNDFTAKRTNRRVVGNSGSGPSAIDGD